MQVYLLKRLLLLPLTIWFIGSVIFLLSRFVPGTYADKITADEQTIFGNTQAVLNRATYLNKLKADGQDKPLFYFSIHSRAVPDTLQRVFPVQQQQFLKKLIQQYGNWPAIAGYYAALQKFKKAVDSSGATIPAVQLANKQEVHIYQATTLHEIGGALSMLQHHQPGIADAGLAEAVSNLQISYDNLIHQARAVNQVVPDWEWNGKNNQYHRWLAGIVHGNLGTSYRDARPVLEIISEAIANSIFLLLSSLILVFTLAIQLSLFLSLKDYRLRRRFILPFLYVLDSIPLFITALLLLTFLAGSGNLGLFPVFGLGAGPAEASNVFIGFLNLLHHLMLPILCLVLGSLPYITIQLFQVMQQVKTSDFITTAWAKGLSEKYVLKRHVLRNAFIPLINLFTGFLPALISGALVLEVIFAIPGTGRLLADSVMARDYPVLLGLVLFIAAFKTAANLLADFLYFTADPRTRLAIE